MVLPGLHDGFGVIRGTPIGTDSDSVDGVRRVIAAYETAVDFELAQIVLGRHGAATSPALVADSNECYLVGSRMAVGRALGAQRIRWACRQVLEPVGGFLYGSGAYIDRQVSLLSDLVQKVHEFVGAEGVG